MRCKLPLLVAMFTLAFAAEVPVVAADTVYIRDTLYVPLRGGQSLEHRIIHRGLRSGTAVERLETNDDTGYTRVRTGEGLEGWLQTQYLVEEPIAADRLDAMAAQAEDLESRHQQTLLRLRESTEAGEALNSRIEALTLENESLTAELQRINELAASTIEIDEENQRLTADRAGLEQQIEALLEENDVLSTERAQAWFLMGAGTILVGLLFGFVIGRRIYHRRNTGGWA